jgi:hypothetical protein
MTTLAIATVVIFVLAYAACWVPASRAMRVDSGNRVESLPHSWIAKLGE